MSTALVLLLGAGIFALAIGVIGCFVGSNDSERRRMLSEQESRRLGGHPWE